MLVCDLCGYRMIMVGREIKPGHPEIWMDGWLCPSKGCQGYGTTSFDGSVSRWPAMTLMDANVHSNIRGAMKFKKSTIG